MKMDLTNRLRRCGLDLSSGYKTELFGVLITGQFCKEDVLWSVVSR